MHCAKEALLHSLDCFILLIVFIFQSIILNYLVINQFIQSSFTFLWFLGDFIVLLVFAFALYSAYRARWKERQSVKGSTSYINSRNSSRNTHRNESLSSNGIGKGNSPIGMDWVSNISKHPFSYFAWILYSCSLIAKIILLFKAKNPPRQLRTDEFFGPQMFQIAIALAAIIFSLLVEAHHDGSGDVLKNAYVKNLSYGTALEILDSVSFLSLLIVKQTHLLYTFTFENMIIGLASVNFLLPSLALYKLNISSFGETCPLQVEIIYKLLHLFLVNIPYLSVRLYLWQYYAYADTSIFIVKNIYSIIFLIRGICPDLRQAYNYYKNRRASRHINPTLTHQNGTGTGSFKSSGKNIDEVSIALRSLTPRLEMVDETDELRLTPSPHPSSVISIMG